MVVPGRADEPDQAGFQAGRSIDRQAIPFKAGRAAHAHFDCFMLCERRQNQSFYASVRSLRLVPVNIMAQPGAQSPSGKADIHDHAIHRENVDPRIGWRMVGIFESIVRRQAARAEELESSFQQAADGPKLWRFDGARFARRRQVIPCAGFNSRINQHTPDVLVSNIQKVSYFGSSIPHCHKRPNLARFGR